VSEADKSYEIEILKKAINKYLDKSISVTEKSLNELEAKHDEVVWDLAIKIYSQSGHKVELSTVRDVVNSRIRTIKYQLTEEARRVAEQAAEEARRVAEVEEARRIAESDSHFLTQVTDALGKFGGNEYKAKIFVKLRKIISEHLSVEESEVSLDSHLSNHLNADELDLVELVLALEEAFEIEIPEEIAESFLGIEVNIVSVGSCWSSSSSSPFSFSSNAGEQCIVRNFVELIYEKIPEEAHRTAESDPDFLDKVTNVPGNAKINPVKDLLDYSQEDLLEIKNFGAKSAEEVIEALQVHLGITLPLEKAARNT
jgi:acyl carrier protein